MGDENPIRTLGDYSKPSHEGYRNTIELPAGNNVVPLQSDTIRLVQNGCSFYGIRSEDPTQHLKDFLKLVDSLDLDGENSERTSITTWEDLTTRFLAQFFPPGRTAKLLNDILMFQQHHGESLSEAWTPGNKLRNKNTDESWEFIENLALYDHEGWDETKEFIRPVKAISTPQGVSKTPDRRLLELEDQINLLLKGSRPVPTSSSARTPQAYANAVHLNSRTHDQQTPEKVLIREEAKFPIIKNLNSISLTKGEEERSNMTKVTPDNTEKPTATEAKLPVIKAEIKNIAENGAENKIIKTPENEETMKAPDSITLDQELELERKKGKEYKVLPGGHVYDAILKKKITKKDDIEGNFEIPCSVGDLKHVNALVYQGSDVNIMPYSTYIKLTDERLAETNIRLSRASHLYIYPLEIAKDVLVYVAKYVYPVDFVILDIKENKKRPFILGTPFLTTAKASIKFDKGTITLRSRKSKVSFHRIPDSSYATNKGVKNDIEPIAPTMTVNRLVLEWEEKIKLHMEREMKFNQWRSKNFKGKHPTLNATKEGMDDEGEVTLYLMRRSLEVFRKFHWMILGGRFNQLSHVSSPLLSKPGEY
ncbi:MAK10-like protein [Tanacetum coccineum]|uniref:MAK10-like protein n=1 Tax=Tanacetum coccineum TaxID=301880 RepID=A0ABQ5IB91_9ASTR